MCPTLRCIPCNFIHHIKEWAHSSLAAIALVGAVVELLLDHPVTNKQFVPSLAKRFPRSLSKKYEDNICGHMSWRRGSQPMRDSFVERIPVAELQFFAANNSLRILGHTPLPLWSAA